MKVGWPLFRTCWFNFVSSLQFTHANGSPLSLVFDPPLSPSSIRQYVQVKILEGTKNMESYVQQCFDFNAEILVVVL